MKRLTMVFALFLLLVPAVQAKLTTEEISYQAGNTTLNGYLAFDDSSKERRPGILVVHEWWGLNDYARMRARMLAELGYTALAVDMYGGGKTASHPEDAARFAGEISKNLPLARERFLAALDVLKQHPTVNPAKIAAIGYCFGGGIVLAMARQGVNLDGVVSFHGSIATEHPAESGEVKAKMLVFNGAADPFVTEEQIAKFKKEMETAGVAYRFVNFPGVKHSFTNPEADRFGEKFDLPLAYSPEADEQSWQEMQEFLKEIFSQ